jgi:hypothetical protein
MIMIVRRSLPVVLALALVVALGPALAHADASVKPPAKAAAFCVQLFVDLAHPTAREVEMAANIRPLGAVHQVRASVLRVRDAAGRVVFTQPNAFLGGGPPWDIALGTSSNASPTLPALPAGEYTAVLSVDGAESAPARFAVGRAPAAPLVLEARGCGCGAPLFAHLYNPGPRTVDLLEAYEGSVLIVDGVRHARTGVEWDGGTALGAHRAWSVGIAPTKWEYGVDVAPGRHRFQLEMGGYTSAVVETELCAGATK